MSGDPSNNRARRRSLTIAAIAGAVAIAALGAIVVASVTRSSETLDGSSAGERIFRSGLDAQGDPIPRYGSFGGMMGGGMMMSRGCAGCHGTDGRGRTTMMFSAPNITYGNLTDPRGLLEPDGERGETFTDADIRRAVIDGLDPEGKPLQAPMPRWQLTGQEWNQLLVYLKTMH